MFLSFGHNHDGNKKLAFRIIHTTSKFCLNLTLKSHNNVGERKVNGDEGDRIWLMGFIYIYEIE
jgi:hypothetical protein